MISTHITRTCAARTAIKLPACLILPVTPTSTYAPADPPTKELLALLPTPIAKDLSKLLHDMAEGFTPAGGGGGVRLEARMRGGLHKLRCGSAAAGQASTFADRAGQHCGTGNGGGRESDEEVASSSTTGGSSSSSREGKCSSNTAPRCVAL